MSPLSLFEPFDLDNCASSLAKLTNITDFNQDWQQLSEQIGQVLAQGEPDLLASAPYLAQRARTLVEPIALVNDAFVINSNETLDNIKAELGLNDETIISALKALSPLSALLGEHGYTNIKPSKAKGKYDIVLSSDNVIICMMVLEFIKNCPKLNKLNLRLSCDRDPSFSMQVGAQTINYEDFLVFVEQVDPVRTNISLICSKLKDEISEEQLGVVALTMLRNLFGDVIARIIFECSLIDVSFDIPAKFQAQLDQAKAESDSGDNIRPVNLKDFYRKYMSHGGKALTKETDQLFITNYREHNAQAQKESSNNDHHNIFEIDTLNTFSPAIDEQDLAHDLTLLTRLGITPITLALAMKQEQSTESKVSLSRMENNQLLKDIERFINRSKCEQVLKVVGSAFAPDHTYLYVLAFNYVSCVELIKNYSAQSKLNLHSIKLTALNDASKVETITI